MIIMQITHKRGRYMKKLPILSAAVLCLMLLCGCGRSLSAMKSETAGADPDSRSVPVIRYAALSKKSRPQGDVCTYSQLEEDIDLYRSLGYEPVLVNDLIRFVNYGGDLPEHPIVLTVDEGYLGCLTELVNLAEKKDARFLITISGELTDHAADDADPDPERTHLDWESIKAMRTGGRFEFANGTYSLFKDTQRRGCLRKKGESERQYRRVIFNDVFTLQRLCDEHCAFKPNVFTFPKGHADDMAKQTIGECGFEAVMTCDSGINHIRRGAPNGLFCLKRIDRKGSLKEEDIIKALGIKTAN